MGQGLLTIDMFAGANRRHRSDGMNVIGGADGHGIDVFGFLVEQNAKVLVTPGGGGRIEGSRSPLVIDVAESDDVGPEFLEGGDVTPTHATRADPGEIDPLAWRRLPGATQHVPRHDGK